MILIINFLFVMEHTKYTGKKGLNGKRIGVRKNKWRARSKKKNGKKSSENSYENWFRFPVQKLLIKILKYKIFSKCHLFSGGEFSLPYLILEMHVFFISLIFGFTYFSFISEKRSLFSFFQLQWNVQTVLTLF